MKTLLALFCANASTPCRSPSATPSVFQCGPPRSGSPRHLHGRPPAGAEVLISRSRRAVLAHEFPSRSTISRLAKAGHALAITSRSTINGTVSGHKGTVVVEIYRLRRPRDGTFDGIDAHAHLNMPATFAYAARVRKSPVSIQLAIRKAPAGSGHATGAHSDGTWTAAFYGPHDG